MTRTFLVCEDYGMGGIWAYFIAESKDEITRRFPNVIVVDEPPPWMNEEERRLTAERMTFDLDEAEQYFTTA